MEKNFVLLMLAVCFGSFICSCSSDDDFQKISKSEVSTPQSSDYSTFLQSVDSLNMAYGLNEDAATKAPFLEYLGGHKLEALADGCGAKIGSQVGKRLGVAFGIAIGNPFVSVGGYYVGGRAGGAAGMVAASYVSSIIYNYLIDKFKRAPVNNQITVSEVKNGDSFGELHNIILNRLVASGNNYLTANGGVLIDKLYDDILKIEKELGIEDNLSNNNTYKIALKQFCNDVVLSIKSTVNNNGDATYYMNQLSNGMRRQGLSEIEIKNYNELSEKLISGSITLHDMQVETYSQDFNSVVMSSTLKEEEKMETVNVGSVIIKSTQYWK